MSRTVAQLLAAAAPGDAVTGQAFAWQRVMRDAGIRSSIHAQHIHPELAGEVKPLAATPRDDAGLLLRYSIWSDAAAVALRSDAPLGVVYHNITPAHLLRELDPNVADLCATGRRMLPAFRHRVRSVVADSAYNAEELEAAGWPDATVIPLLLDLPSPPAASEPSDPSILFVGRIVPSKRIDDLIRVLAYVREHHIPGATLDIIGALPERGTYVGELRSLIDQLGLQGGARLRGRVSDAERDAAYAHAGVYLSMSAHEGFCAPLLEAMAHGLPVVARAAGAVRETTGRAALLVDGPDIALAGEAVAAALTDMRVRSGLRANAVRRLADVRPQAIEPAILGAVTPLLTA